jgi:hypothetical protein
MRSPQFNFAAIGTTGAEAQTPAALILWLNRQFTLLKKTLPGPSSFDAGTATTTKSVGLTVGDLTFLTIAGNAAITLEKPRTGGFATLEVEMDGTGGWVPTFINATGTGGAVPAPATGAGKKTMYDAAFNGDVWVLSVRASNY